MFRYDTVLARPQQPFSLSGRHAVRRWRISRLRKTVGCWPAAGTCASGEGGGCDIAPAIRDDHLTVPDQSGNFRH